MSIIFYSHCCGSAIKRIFKARCSQTLIRRPRVSRSPGRKLKQRAESNFAVAQVQADAGWCVDTCSSFVILGNLLNFSKLWG